MLVESRQSSVVLFPFRPACSRVPQIGPRVAAWAVTFPLVLLQVLALRVTVNGCDGPGPSQYRYTYEGPYASKVFDIS